MPIYEYKCVKCSNQFSKLVFGQDTKVECPNCKSDEVEKLISVISSASGSSAGSGSAGCCGGSAGFR
jgi:putative FmdB family regulatory protein